MIKRLKGKGGFTLLELIMVIIIIGILATLAVPQYTSFVEKARAAEAINTIGAIKTAEDMARLEGSSYLDDADDPGLAISFPTSGTATFWTYAVTGGTADGYVITATRTSRGGFTTGTDDTIIFTWTGGPITGSGIWSGDHVGIPQNVT